MGCIYIVLMGSPPEKKEFAWPNVVMEEMLPHFGLLSNSCLVSESNLVVVHTFVSTISFVP